MPRASDVYRAQGAPYEQYQPNLAYIRNNPNLAYIGNRREYVDLNLLVGVVSFTFSPLHCFYATIIEGGAADRRRRPILVYPTIGTTLFRKVLFVDVLVETRAC